MLATCRAVKAILTATMLMVITRFEPVKTATTTFIQIITVQPSTLASRTTLTSTATASTVPRLNARARPSPRRSSADLSVPPWLLVLFLLQPSQLMLSLQQLHPRLTTAVDMLRADALSAPTAASRSTALSTSRFSDFRLLGTNHSKPLKTLRFFQGK